MNMEINQVLEKGWRWLWVGKGAREATYTILQKRNMILGSLAYDC